MTEQTFIESFVETILIADFKSRRDDMLQQYFAASEREIWKDRPAESIAGRIALKSAVCALAEKQFSLSDISPRDFIVTTDEYGAPMIAEVRTDDRAVARVLETEVFVSISHSRTAAAGLAVIARRSAK